MFGFLKGLSRTADAIKTIIPKKKVKISKDELEDILLESDVHYDLIEKILSEIPYDEVKRDQLESKLLACFNWTYFDEKEFVRPKVQLIIGVNGAGKTTTIAKLSQKYLNDGKTVMLGAADTFRAAAIEQLSRWADKIGVPIVATQQGHDPSAVAYDAIASAKAKDMDNCNNSTT